MNEADIDTLADVDVSSLQTFVARFAHNPRLENLEMSGILLKSGEVSGKNLVCLLLVAYLHLYGYLVASS